MTHPLLTRLRSLPKWLYTEFGIASVWHTGRDAWFIILARTCRMIAYGANSLIIALFFSALGFTDWQIGLFMTLTLLGDVLLSLFLSLIADRIGRRKILFAGAVLMVVSGAVFAYFENFYILLSAAVVGIISASGGDFGPFRAIEESTLSGITKPETRSDVLSWYVTTSSLGSALGTELSGRFVERLTRKPKWTLIDAYHAIFWSYVVMGLLNMAFAFFMSDKCELPATPPPASKSEASERLLNQEDSELSDHEDGHSNTNQHQYPAVTTPQSNLSPAQKFLSLFAQISLSTRQTMYKLWALLIADSTADGMVSYSLTNYYLDRKFALSHSFLGDITSISYLLASLSTIFAGPLAKRLGLINTMVFTHIPSSAAVLLFPAPQSIWLTVLLFFIRTGLNNMDQAPRTAFIAAVVKPSERTAVMGITSMLRTLAAAGGPFITGVLAGTDAFWIAFVAAGTLRIAYDLGLWAMFVGVDVRRVEEERSAEARSGDGGGRRSLDEEVGSPLEAEEGVEIEMQETQRRAAYAAPQTPGFRVS